MTRPDRVVLPKKPFARQPQTIFLNELRKQQRTVRVWLVTGKWLSGKLDAFDDYCLILRDKRGFQELIFKHAIVDIRPIKSGPVFKTRANSSSGDDAEPE